MPGHRPERGKAGKLVEKFVCKPYTTPSLKRPKRQERKLVISLTAISLHSTPRIVLATLRVGDCFCHAAQSTSASSPKLAEVECLDVLGGCDNYPDDVLKEDVQGHAETAVWQGWQGSSFVSAVIPTACAASVPKKSVMEDGRD